MMRVRPVIFAATPTGELWVLDALSGVQQNTSRVKCAAMIIKTGTTLGRLLASYIDAERLGPQSHRG